MEISEIFRNSAPIKYLFILLNQREGIRSSKLSSLSESSSYSFTCKIIKELEILRLIEYEKIGKKKLIKLTDRGREISIELLEINQELCKSKVCGDA